MSPSSTPGREIHSSSPPTLSSPSSRKNMKIRNLAVPWPLGYRDVMLAGNQTANTFLQDQSSAARQASVRQWPDR